jgi:quercetin dioxygenase-like cupin family protein
MPPGDHSPRDHPGPSPYSDEPGAAPGDEHDRGQPGQSTGERQPDEAVGGEQPDDVLMVEHLLAPDGLIPAAHSSGHDRYAYVLQGQMTARIGRETIVAGPGSIVSIPRGFRHAMWSADGSWARVRVLHVLGPREGPARDAA